MNAHLRALATAGALSTLVAACSADAEPRNVEARTTVAAPVRELTVTAADFHFRSADTIPAGLTRIRLVNEGPEFHHVQLVRIAEGHTLEEFLRRLAAGELTPSWVSYVGGPNSPDPGGESAAVLDLEPGSYAMICIIPSPDGRLHVAKGMFKPLTVTPAAVPTSPEPRADVRMALTDYAFETTPDIRAGTRTIRVESTAEQPHEVVFLRLAPGKDVRDVMQFFEAEAGPPPFTLVAGTTALGKGEVNFLTVAFEPGEYVLICMVPDAKDGRPHIAHGMIRQVTVG